jgi:sugar/nucleoside kinase (ribokinase family)
MQNLLDTDVVNRLVAPDATYVSLNTEDAELFLEDTYATAASFRQDGSWTVQTQPGAEPFRV